MSLESGSSRYLTLYRKYRSRNFSEIVGQKTAVTVLRNSVKYNRIANAYLLSGPRGTGKTSLARIFAKALNCPNVQDGDPCGICNVCLEIANGSSLDIYELDAASHRSVEDIEQLIESSQFAPSELNYRVFIVDEVHMISDAAFNAFLKTLEEPPRYAVFVLCTTEPHKLPATILSRCIKLECTRLPLLELSAHLQAVAQKEGVVLEEEAANLLCELGHCSARDSLSLLEQAISFYGDKVTTDNVRDLFRLVLPEAFVELASAILSYNCAKASELFTNLINNGHSTDYLLLQLGDVFKALYLNDESIVKLPDDIKKLSFNPADLSLAISDIWLALISLKDTTHPVLIGQITIFKLCERFNPSTHNLNREKAGVNENQDTFEISKTVNKELTEHISVNNVHKTEVTPEVEINPKAKLEPPPAVFTDISINEAATGKTNKSERNIKPTTTTKSTPVIQPPPLDVIADIIGQESVIQNYNNQPKTVAPDFVQAEIDPLIAPHWNSILDEIHKVKLALYCHLIKISYIWVKEETVEFVFASEHELDFMAIYSQPELSNVFINIITKHIPQLAKYKIFIGFIKQDRPTVYQLVIKQTDLDKATDLALRTFKDSKLR